MVRRFALKTNICASVSEPSTGRLKEKKSYFGTLCHGFASCEGTRAQEGKSPRWRGRHREHARRVHSPGKNGAVGDGGYRGTRPSSVGVDCCYLDHNLD